MSDTTDKIVVGVGLGLAALTIAVVAYEAATYVPPPPPPPPPPGKPDVRFLSYNVQQDNAVVSDAVYFNPDTGVDLSTAGDFATRMEAIKAKVPGLVYTFRASTVAAINSLPSLAGVEGISSDWEPNNGSFTSWAFQDAVNNFTALATAAHAKGVKSYAYPTGRPLLEPSLQQYNWDYSKLPSDAVWIETQTYVKNGATGVQGYEAAFQKLATQFAGQLDRLRVQVSLGDGGNGTTPDTAIAAFKYASTLGINHWYLEFTLTQVAYLEETLKGLVGSVGGGGGGGTLPTGITNVVVLMMENQSEAGVIGNSACPYFSSLAKAYSYATNYHGITGYSLGNYEALTAGQVTVTGDVEPPSAYQQNVSNIADLCDTKGLTWSAYAEGYAPNWLTTKTVLPYSRHHEPFLYYKDITTNATRLGHIKALTQFSPGSMPNYCMITPDNDHNGHTGQSNAADSDKWASTFVPSIIASPQMAHGLLIIVWDNDNKDGTSASPCIFVGPSTKGVGAVSTNYDHYNTLHTIEALLGLPTLTTNDAKAATMTDMFQASS